MKKQEEVQVASDMFALKEIIMGISLSKDKKARIEEMTTAIQRVLRTEENSRKQDLIILLLVATLLSVVFLGVLMLVLDSQYTTIEELKSLINVVNA